jgi:hypothetical protein
MTKDRSREGGESPKRAAVPGSGQVESEARAGGFPSPLDVPDEASADDKDPDISRPWSYSSDDLEAIRRAVPKTATEHDAWLLADASATARMFVRHMRLRSSSKPNPRDEIKRLKNAVEELREAIDGLSSQAQKHLRDNLRPVRAPGEKPFAASSLCYALDRFSHENRDALERPPEIRRGGPATKGHVQWLVFRLWLAFTHANGGNQRARGFPAFRKACCDPLQPFGLAPLSDEAWESVLTKAKAHAREERNHLVKGAKGRA